MTGAASVGFFGKLPCNGDFLQRRAPQEFVDCWDTWLQECIHASREALREQWLDAYLTGPVWRFVISGGVCGSGAYAGVMLPSVDRVGRYFPLTLVTQVDTDESPLELACRATQWFDAAEALAISALEATELDLDSFDEQVASLAGQLPASNAAHTSALWSIQEQIGFPAQGHQWQIALPGAHDLQTAVNVLAFRVLGSQLRPLTLWWTDGASAVSPSWLVMRGLPAPPSFTAMLSGQWRNWGWSSAEASFEPAQPYRAPGGGELPLTIPQPANHERANAGRALHPDIVVRSDMLTTRPSAVAENRAAYVARPEIGLWAIAAPPNTTAKPDAVQLVADLLNQLPDAGSLSALVESVRAALMEGHAHLVSRAGSAPDALANTLVVLARGSECAVLFAGPVQLMRARGHELQAIIDPGVAGEAVGEPRNGNSLMGLFSADTGDTAPLGAGDLQAIAVRYELVVPGDCWLLFGGTSVDGDNWPRLAAFVASGMPMSAAAVAQSLAKGAQEAFPVLVLQFS